MYPEKQLATWTAIRYSSDHIFDYIELDGDYAIFEIAVPASWAGKTVGQLDVRKKYNINIMALRQNGVLSMDITSHTVMPRNATLLVLGSMKSIQKCFRI